MSGVVNAQTKDSTENKSGGGSIEVTHFNVSVGAGMMHTNFGRLADLFPNGGNSPHVHNRSRSFEFSLLGFNPSKRFAWGIDFTSFGSRSASDSAYKVENSASMMTLNFGVNWLPKCKHFHAITMVGIGGIFGDMTTSNQQSTGNRGRQNISYDSFLANPVQSTNISYNRWLGKASILLQYNLRKRWVLGAKATAYNSITGRSFTVNENRIKGAPTYSPQGSSLTFLVGYRF